MGGGQGLGGGGRENAGRPCFIGLSFVALDRPCISYKLKVYGHPALSKSSDWHYFPRSIGSLHVFGSHFGHSPNIPKFSISVVSVSDL